LIARTSRQIASLRRSFKRTCARCERIRARCSSFSPSIARFDARSRSSRGMCERTGARSGTDPPSFRSPEPRSARACGSFASAPLPFVTSRGPSWPVRGR
jgi:hypothetical protein